MATPAGRRSLAALALAAAASAQAVEFKANGRFTFGINVRAEDPAPDLMVQANARALGVPGEATAGTNTDDGNLNYRRGDVLSRVLKGYLDLKADAGTLGALVRVSGWYDHGLLHDARPWGNNPNHYTPNAPLSDLGAVPLARFSGLAVNDAYLQHATRDLRVRVGRQTLGWGERAPFTGGIALLNPVNLPAARRAGAVPAEFRIAQPMVTLRLATATMALEAFWQRSFRPGVLDLCGTFWAATDYMAEGCNRAFSGPFAGNDRQRLAAGSYLLRIDSPFSTGGAQFGAAFSWKSDAAEYGLYAARYTTRVPFPGLRKSARVGGPPLVPGDPDGRNLAYFSGYVRGVDVVAASVSAKRGHASWYGELAYRPNQPVQLPASDVLSAFLNPTAPALLRADADAVAPGGYFHAYDRYRTAQLQMSVQREFGLGLTGGAELVLKHAFGLPDPALRRYGRADIFGIGPVNGVCNASGAQAARQCSLDGYVSPTAIAYRLRLDAKLGQLMPGVTHALALQFVHEVKGWSYDFQLNEGRHSASVTWRTAWRKRYLTELAYAPVWGGKYNGTADRDQLSLMAGVQF